jgi:hypothetical protein
LKKIERQCPGCVVGHHHELCFSDQSTVTAPEQ